MHHTDPSPLADADLVVATVSPDARTAAATVAALAAAELVTRGAPPTITGDEAIDQRVHALAHEAVLRHLLLREPVGSLREVDPGLVQLLEREADEAQRSVPGACKSLELAHLAVLYADVDGTSRSESGTGSGRLLASGVAGTVALTALAVDGAATYGAVAQATGAKVYEEAGSNVPVSLELNAVALALGAVLMGATLASLIDRQLRRTITAGKHVMLAAAAGLVGLAAALGAIRLSAMNDDGQATTSDGALAFLITLTCVGMPLVAAAAARKFRDFLFRGSAPTTDPAATAQEEYAAALMRRAQLDARIERPALVEHAFGSLVAAGVSDLRARLAHGHRRAAATVLLRHLLEFVPAARRDLIAHLARKVVKHEVGR